MEDTENTTTHQKMLDQLTLLVEKSKDKFYLTASSCFQGFPLYL
jgi:hypothetical protein